MDGKLKVLLIAGALGIVLVVVVLKGQSIRGRGKAKDDGSAGSFEPMTAKDGKQAKGRKKGNAIERRDDELRKQKEIVLGFSSVPVKRNKGTIEVTVDWEITDQCQWGDFDVMEKELAKAPNKRLLVTLEPLDGGSPVVSQEVTLDDLKKGKLRSLKMPDGKGALKPMGMFICTDSDKAGSCREKQSANMAKAYHEGDVLVADGEAKKPKFKDKSYYFQYLQVQNGSLQVLNDTQMKDAGYDKIRRYYDERGGEARGAKGAVDDVKRLNNAIVSVAPKVGPSGLKLSLPRGNSAVCKSEPKSHLPAPQEIFDQTPPPAPDMSKGPAKVWSMPESERLPPSLRKKK